jgi:fluoride ion exporter CrcB/FEX
MYNFLHITLIFFGAGIGGVFRYIISNKVTGFISKSLIVSNTYITFPFPTLFVNFVGSFVIGILYNIIIIKTPHLDVELKLLFITGFL